MRCLLVMAPIVMTACTPPSTIGPRLCVDSLGPNWAADGGGIPACEVTIGEQTPCASLTPGAAILVQHVLPDDVTPYGHELLVTLSSGASNEERSVAYGQSRNGGTSRYRALTVFDFPDAGPSIVTIHAAILNSELTVTGTTGACN